MYNLLTMEVHADNARGTLDKVSIIYYKLNIPLAGSAGAPSTEVVPGRFLVHPAGLFWGLGLSYGMYG